VTKQQDIVDVAIIGAGPAGLTAAYLLSKKGYSVTVIEKDERYVGGISRTVEHDGYRFDIGGHRFFSKSKEVVDSVERDPARRLHPASAHEPHLL
jgi:protoporphyrinogen oxidase